MPLDLRANWAACILLVPHNTGISGANGMQVGPMESKWSVLGSRSPPALEMSHRCLLTLATQNLKSAWAQKRAREVVLCCLQHTSGSGVEASPNAL